MILQITSHAIWSLIYNLFISPLRKVPGPKLWAISPIPQALMQCSGNAHKDILAMHLKYGNAVRTGPDAVSLLSPSAWKEVNGHHQPGQPEINKDPGFVKEIKYSVLGVETKAAHGQQRRILAHGFSAQSMAKQEPLIRGYVDLLFQRFREFSDAGMPIDLTKWYNFATFDIIGDLTFGEPFGCLESSTFHTWVAMIFENFKQGGILRQLRRALPMVAFAIEPVFNILAGEKIRKHDELVRANITKRKALGSERPDFMQSMIALDKYGKEVRFLFLFP
jgi:cytochrome P450